MASEVIQMAIWSNRLMDVRVVKVDDFKFEVKYAVRYHYSSRVYRAIAILLFLLQRVQELQGHGASSGPDQPMFSKVCMLKHYTGLD